MENKKGSYKRYAGKVRVESMDGRIINAMIGGLIEAGIEVISNPIINEEGRFLGEIMELYEIV